MDRHPTTSEQPTYDLIFAGGGATACVIAGRLAAADSTLRILIVENGSHTKDKPFHVQPGRYMNNMMCPEPGMFTPHETSASAELNGRTLRASNASCVGGGGSINGMMYARASASDYDDWEKLGNPGWGSADLIPLAQKHETYQAGPPGSTHGSSGPLKVSYGCHETHAGRDFLKAAAVYGRGRRLTDDGNDFVTCDAYSRWPKYIGAETGRRSDAAHFYLYPQTENTNLTILDHARVNRVLFDDDNRATGIEYTRGSDKTICTAHASRFVIVSSGTFCSSAILERSGIGSKDLLQQLGIPLVSDLPGVGENYQDHSMGLVPYYSPPETVNLSILTMDENAASAHESEWLATGKGLMASNGVDAGIRIRPNAKDLEELGPAFQKRWEEFFSKASDKPIAWIGPYGCYFGNHPTLTIRPSFTILYLTTYPVALGRVHVQSRDAFAPLHVESGILKSREDLVVLRWAYKWSRELARRMDGYRGEVVIDHPVFPAGSEATCGEASGPVDISARDIVYTKVDDDAIDAFHRDNINMAWHALGTCAMRPRNQGGVVDARLNVYGVKNLKVADMSVAPLNVGANTYNTAMVIGEKAATIIAEELINSNV
ncbi:GMC oxidoreductase-domain-containing protein [Mycena albidolilacea]|uniref:GMC oxidoreductase-domain-containing protein n=1 Tax=Mycena albidolilacea TaxID=1033008 RepID=A0AAD7EEN5_9AGAR|nr:GMC oxidoreductase-domain-containing protein [Mycena albidolilacea]